MSRWQRREQAERNVQAVMRQEEQNWVRRHGPGPSSTVEPARSPEPTLTPADDKPMFEPREFQSVGEVQYFLRRFFETRPQLDLPVNLERIEAWLDEHARGHYSDKNVLLASQALQQQGRLMEIRQPPQKTQDQLDHESEEIPEGQLSIFTPLYELQRPEVTGAMVRSYSKRKREFEPKKAAETKHNV